MKFRFPTVQPILWWTEPDQGFYTMRVTSPFAMRSDGFHGALDIGNHRLYDDVVACGPGKVIAEGFLKEPWSSATTRFATGNYGGLMAVIEHAPGIVSIYAHLNQTVISVGDAVASGQKIGTIGETGSAIGQGHLHFGVQMRADLVPAGVATHTTALGLGLDVDPWPLITGRVEIDTQEEQDMRFTGSQLKVIDGAAKFTLSAASNFRAAATRQSDAIAQFPAGTPVYPSVSVDGELIGDNDQWAMCFMYVGTAYVLGYFHTSVLQAPPVPTDYTALYEAEKAKTSTLQTTIQAQTQTIAQLKTKIAAAKSALA